MLITSISLILALAQSSTAIGGRPLSWDWFGVVPLEAAQTPSPEQQKEFEDMRKGDYFLAYIPARNHLRAHPSDVVDVWIMRECAKKRGTSEELLAESETLLKDHPTTATRLLHTYALNLFYKAKRQRDRTHNPFNDLRHQIQKAEADLRADASQNFAAAAALLASLNSDVMLTRTAMLELRKNNPQSLEAATLYVRSLLRGEFGVDLGHTDRSGKFIPAPHQDRFRLRPPLDPRMDDALIALDAMEKRFGKQPLIDYYRAMAYSMKAYFRDPKKDDEVALQAQGIRFATSFLAGPAKFPRLRDCVVFYLKVKDFAAFFPPPDE